MKVLKHVFSRFLLALLAIVISGSVFAQRHVTGKVIADDGTGLPGVNVVVPGTTVGTTTDANGNYSFDVPANTTTLKFSFIGFEASTLPISENGVVNVNLQLVTNVLDAIVVTGYGGTQKISKLTNSISTVPDNILKIGVYANPAQALSGAVAGLKVVQASGNPGAVPTLILRGGTNLDGTGSPLYIVDGQQRSDLSAINPENIESIEVLKDAGATAIYGARANNGVVLVTTKRGKEGKTELMVKSKVTLNYINNPYKFLNAEDFIAWARTSVNNSANVYQKSDSTWTGWTSPLGVGTTFGPFLAGNQYFAADSVTPLDGNKTSLAVWSPMYYTDNLSFLLDQGWKKMVDPVTGKDLIYSEFNRALTAFNNPAITQDFNVSASGGNDKGSYYAGLGYNYSQGLPVKTWYKSINFILNGDYKIRKWLTSSSSLQFSDAKWYDVTTSESRYFGRMLSAPPTQREYNASGQLLLGINSNDGNPLYNINNFNRTNVNNKFTLGQTLKFDIIKGLNVKLNAIWMYDETSKESFNKNYLSSPGITNTTRASSAQFDRVLRQTYNAVANYDVTVANDHNINVLAGVEYYNELNYGLSAAGSGAPTPDFGDLQYTSNGTGLRTVDSWHSNERIESSFGRVNYDFKTKYLLSFTFREDGYSKLLGDNRWGFFPGVSGGWVISKESFMSNMKDIVSFLKLRASYGQNGNVSGIGPYTLQGSYGTNLYNGNMGYSLSTVENPGLKWEHSNTFEVGTDMAFLQNRITAYFTYYNRLTIDKLASIPLPNSSGILSITTNNGELRNNGLELELGFKVLRTDDFTWDISANISYNTNVVVKLPDNGLIRNRQSAIQVYGNNNDTLWVGGYQEGQRPGALYGFLAEGIYKDDAQVSSLAGNRIDKSTGNNGSDNKILYGPDIWATMTDAQKAKGLPIQAGDVIWKDVNGDDVIDDKDQVYIGNVNPKWIGGITSTFSWKGLTFYARMDYALGFYQNDLRLPWMMGAMQGSYNTVIQTKEDSWTPSNPDAYYPKYMWVDQNGKRNYARQTSMFMYNASYLAFREFSLSYNLPANWLKPVRLEGLEFSVSGQNLGYWTKSKVYSPEISSTSSLDAGYPLPRTVIFGINLKF